MAQLSPVCILAYTGVMDSIADLLTKHTPSEPPEIQAIKQYVQQQFKESVHVMIRERDVVITVRSSAVAGALRMRKIDLGSILNAPGKQIIFRVGSVV